MDKQNSFSNKTIEALKMLQEARENFNIINGIVGEYIYVSGMQGMNSDLVNKKIALDKAIDKLLECLNEQTN